MLTPKKNIQIFGITWLFVGISLLTLGTRLTCREIPLEWASLLMGSSLLLGLLKGQTVLKKVALRAARRLSVAPAPFWRIYSRRDILLILLMMGLGMLLRVLHTPSYIRGPILVAVGFALFQGGLFMIRRSSQVNLG